jgi:predicted transglutaminase-like cysteine proteinase
VLRHLLALALVFGAGQAVAGSAHLGPVMITGKATSQPVGHYEFCKTNTDECRVRSDDVTPVSLTPSAWKELVTVNSDVNARVAPKTDQDHYGREEVWTYPDDEGDCEDYALEKRRMLLKAGLSASDLLITVLRKPDGEGHAVLTVRTDKGDYVLDNLSPEVRLWSDTDYTFLKRQSEFNSGKWVSIQPHDDTAVGAVR